MTFFEKQHRLAGDGLGLDCSAVGLSLAGAPLPHKGAQGFSARPKEEVDVLIKAAYGETVDPARLADGLDVVARALSSGDLGRAMIAALRLKLPDLDEGAAARVADVDGALAKYDPSERRDWRGRWTTGADAGSTNSGASRLVSGQPERRRTSDNQVPARLMPVSFEMTGDRVYPDVTAFRSRHLVDAIKLASIIGHGATADEVLTVGGAENTWGTKGWAKDWANFFGLQAKGDKSYFPGQIGIKLTNPPKGQRPKLIAQFRVADGFWWSGLVFANKMARAARQASMGATALADPRTFFTLAHQNGWGTTRPGDYVGYALKCHRFLRNSAQASERSSLTGTA
jgi:hypothetical protein